MIEWISVLAYAFLGICIIVVSTTWLYALSYFIAYGWNTGRLCALYNHGKRYGSKKLEELAKNIEQKKKEIKNAKGKNETWNQ